MSSGINNNPVRGGNINNLTAKYEYWTDTRPHYGHLVGGYEFTYSHQARPGLLVFVIIGCVVPLRLVKLPAVRVLVGQTDCYNRITSRWLSGPGSELTVWIFPGGLWAAAPMRVSTPPTTSTGPRSCQPSVRWRESGSSPGARSLVISTTGRVATLLPSWSWLSPRPSSSPTQLTSSVLHRETAGSPTELTRPDGGSPRTWTATG